MKHYYVIRQNNSGGKFLPPAVNVVVEADNIKQLRQVIRPHIALCRDSGLYADYDACGCCPCCGHRWLLPCSDKPEKPEKLVAEIRERGLSYMGATATALIKADGSLIIGDTQEHLDAIRAYTTPTPTRHE